MHNDLKRTFYFDTKDGVTVRDRSGSDFVTRAEAIEHSKALAEKFRQNRTHTEADCIVSVIDVSGAEIHVEVINPDLNFTAPR
jgi:hypothetical protein